MYLVLKRQETVLVKLCRKNLWVDVSLSLCVLVMHQGFSSWDSFGGTLLKGHTISVITCSCLILNFSFLRLTVQNFWSSETRLPTSTLDRLVTMLEAMYSARTEQQYLSYATNLILEMTSKSPDYQREIFEFPLSECRFSVSK